MKSSKSIVDSYLKKEDWRVNENSNSPFSFGGLNKYITAEVSKDYSISSYNAGMNSVEFYKTAIKKIQAAGGSVEVI